MFGKTKVKISLAVSVIFFSVAIIFVSGFFGELFFYSENKNNNFVAQATTIDHNMIGWAWSENVGWISLNSSNCDTDNDGKSEGATGCPAAESVIANYGVDLNLATNSFSGYAWSEHIGWIKFDPAGPYPQYPNIPVTRSGDQITGWARASNGSVPLAGNWDGWIKMSGLATNGASYGVSLVGGSTFQGEAWGSEVVGWIRFSGTSSDGTPYGTRLSNTPPEARNLAITQSALADGDSFYCANGPSQTRFSWDFYDPDFGSAQTAYQVQIATDNNFPLASIVKDSLEVPSASNSYVPGSGLTYGVTYYWRVRVKDDKDQWSLDWTKYSSSIVTPAHEYPTINFNWSPSSPSQDEEVQFTDLSTVYGSGTTKSAWLWSIPDATYVIGSASSQNPLVKFTATGSKPISLQVTDSQSYSCKATNAEIVNNGVTGKTFNVKIKLPNWKEVSP